MHIICHPHKNSTNVSVCVCLTLDLGQRELQPLHRFGLVTFKPGQTELLMQKHKE